MVVMERFKIAGPINLTKKEGFPSSFYFIIVHVVAESEKKPGVPMDKGILVVIFVQATIHTYRYVHALPQ